MRSRWFHLPLLHTAHDHEKKVSWLELFYDLIFVAAIIQLGDALSYDVSDTHEAFAPLARFFALFTPLWVAWSGFTFFANRFDLDDFAQRTLVFIKMFSVGAMAISVPNVLKGDVMMFAIANSVALSTVALMHLRTWRQVPEARSYSAYWGIVFAASAAIWFVSAWVPTPFTWVLWAMGVGAIIGAPLNKRSRALMQAFPIDMEHLAERYGLLTIIVLGESFVKVLSELAGLDASQTGDVARGGLNLLLTCCVWWIYFDDVAGARLREGRGNWIVWFLGHLPLAAAVTASGVAIKKAISFEFTEPPDPAYAWLLAGTLSLVFLAVAIIDSVTDRRQAELSDRTRVNVRFATSAILLLFGVVGERMTGGTYLALVTLICVANVIFDVMMAPVEERELHNVRSTAEMDQLRRMGRAKRQRDLPTRIAEPLRLGAPSELRRDLYFFFIEGSWTRLMAALVFLYVVANALFAALYLFVPGSISGGEDTFADAFFFSVQTMSTIGYGAMSPATAWGDMIVTIEAATGMLGVALATGLMFAKASRPQSGVLFSQPVVVTRRNGVPTLMFRLANARGNDIVDASITVSALIDETTPEGHHLRRLHTLELARDRSPVFTMSWTVMHELTESSPLYGITADAPEDKFLGLIVTMLGHDSTYAQNTHTRHLYGPNDLRFGERFVDVIHELEDGRLMIDYANFHDTQPDADAVADMERRIAAHDADPPDTH